MFNSKLGDSRFWAKWRASGAVGTCETAAARNIILAYKSRKPEVQSGEEMIKAIFENTNNVVSIGGDLYVKTPGALTDLLGRLRKIGYQVEDSRMSDYRDKKVDAETMEKNGWALWDVRLNARRGKCKSCNSFISTMGIQCHGHKCEVCDAVTYRNIIDGSDVRFEFIPNNRDGHGMADITMTAKRWDTENGFLYLYPEVQNGLWLKGEYAQKYFEANKECWEEVEEDGQKLIRVRYPEPWDYEVSAIQPLDIRGHEWNHEIVLVWDGKEYGEYLSDFPVPKSFSIYETWHWAPLESSPTLHKRVLLSIHNHDDKGWHYQDRRPWFNRQSFAQMGKFIRHFTTLDSDLWDKQSQRFRLDGPGGIDDVAAFCHPDAKAENRPNIGNLLVGFGKAMSEQELTEDEMMAMVDAAKDPGIVDQFLG